MHINRFLVGLAVAILFFAGAAWTAWATDDADLPTTEWRAFVAANYLKGLTSVIAATSTTSSVSTTAAAYPDGVHALCLYNAGSGVTYFTIDGSDPSAANCAFALPSGVGVNSVTETLVTSIHVYTASTATIYLTW